MAFAITQNCCNDASCLSVCPVNCIHPTPDEPEFGKTELLFIDPRSCIDCGACADACPVDAITRVSRLTPDQAIYADINADFYKNRPMDPAWDAPKFPPTTVNDLPSFSVAIVGTGPAASYAAQALLRVADTRVTFYDKLTTPGGLARFGVAPDHIKTRRIGEHFRGVFTHPRVTMRLGVNVGTDIDHATLAGRFDAVIYAVGADQDRSLALPGLELPGSMSARTIVGWYTGHPEAPTDAVDLSNVDRVVIIGNGNVALDAARILTADPDHLTSTEISSYALNALRRSTVREVTIVARRGPEHAAFTRSECKALVDRPGVDVAIFGDPDVSTTIDSLPLSSPASALKGVPTADPTTLPTNKRITFSFGRAPIRINGTDRVESIDIGIGDDEITIPSELVLLAIGYRGAGVADVPFDDQRGTIRNVGGRIVDADDRPVEGSYVVGWAKRGATGGIGDNKVDAEETVAAILDDLTATASSIGRKSRDGKWYGQVRSRLTGRQ